MTNTIPIVDIFAGPGGLGEGFSALGRTEGSPRFETALAAEMDNHAHQTLTLRSFFRMFPEGHAPKSYYEYISGKSALPYTDETYGLWEKASAKILHLELGKPDHDTILDNSLTTVLKDAPEWVLLGGPPCQAYSTIGRWKYRTDEGHDIGSDARAHLYKQYLRVIRKHSPSVFVMENVKGLLSSKYFQLIIDDLKKPNAKGEKYHLYSLVTASDPGRTSRLKPSDYLIRAEEYGIPQRRHRVIILGVREGIKNSPGLISAADHVCTAKDVLTGLPRLRSGLSKDENSDSNWNSLVSDIADRQAQRYKDYHKSQITNLKQNSKTRPKLAAKLDRVLAEWLNDPNLMSSPNHETRGHMRSDLERYYFAATFAKKHGRTPRDTDFPTELDPNHKSWKTNKFNDRFRVQVEGLPATTVVSHISKDGHSFIHPDPSQCRSLTVREAARLQTFPDNYFFEGPRTEQYRQVGNAVPPLLANQIAQVVADLLE